MKRKIGREWTLEMVEDNGVFNLSRSKGNVIRQIEAFFDKDQAMQAFKNYKLELGHKESRIYTYGALKPTDGMIHIENQLKLAYDYRCDLVDLENRRRDKIEDIRAVHYPRLLEIRQELQALSEKIDDLYAEWNKRNSKVRKKTDQPELQEEIEAVKSLRKPFWEEQSKINKEANKNEVVKDQIKENNDEHHVMFLALRNKYSMNGPGLYSGTYQKVEATVSTGKETRKDPRTGKVVHIPRPRKRRYDGCGKIACQLQASGNRPPLHWPDLFYSDDTRIQLDEIAANAFTQKKGRKTYVSPKKARYTVAHLRVKSDQKGRPMWAKIPVFLHRPIPEGAAITWVWLTRFKIGTNFRYKLQFTVGGDGIFGKDNLAEQGSVGIDVGWRTLGEKDEPKSLRVASWFGSDGKRGEFIIPPEKLSRWEYVKVLDSERDVRYNEVAEPLHEFVLDNPTPDWLFEATAGMANWGNSQSRLSAIVSEWATKRFAGDEEIYDALEKWRKEERKLFNNQRFITVNNFNWRTYHYRELVNELARNYKTAIVESLDWAELQKNKPKELDRYLNKYYRAAASVGNLVSIIKSGFAETIAAPAEFTTLACHYCGLVQPDASDEHRKELVWTCEGCGKEWDQDENAAINLLNAPKGLLNYDPRDLPPLNG